MRATGAANLGLDQAHRPDRLQLGRRARDPRRVRLHVEPDRAAAAAVERLRVEGRARPDGRCRGFQSSALGAAASRRARARAPRSCDGLRASPRRAVRQPGSAASSTGVSARLELLALVDERLRLVELAPELVGARVRGRLRLTSQRPVAPLPRRRARRRSRRRGSSRARCYSSAASCLAVAPSAPKRRPQARPTQTVGRSDSGHDDRLRDPAHARPGAAGGAPERDRRARAREHRELGRYLG